MSIVKCARCGAKNRVDEKAAEVRRPVCGKCGSPLKLSAQAGGADDPHPLIVTDDTFEREVLGERARPVVVDFWAEWCGPCRMFAPVLDQLAAEAAGRYRVAKLNVDENPRTAAQFRVQSIPTLLIFRDGALAHRLVGVQTKQAVLARLV